jgi:hypothetical protein
MGRRSERGEVTGDIARIPFTPSLGFVYLFLLVKNAIRAVYIYFYWFIAIMRT